jgi:hypothetical protein
MTTTNEILESIDDRLIELTAEIDALEAARAALDLRGGEKAAEEASVESPAPAPAVARPMRRTRATRRARRTQPVSAADLERLLSDADGLADGLTTTALAQRANAGREQVLAILRELESAGQVRRTGQRRATRWHAITDEERIAQRAAELAAQSRSRQVG